MITDRPDASSSPPPDGDEVSQSGLVAQLDMMIRALWASPLRPTLTLLQFALFLIIVAAAYGQIRLNNWNRPFYDALARRDIKEFVFQLGVFGIIAGTLLVLNVAQRWFGEMLKLKLREGLTRDLVDNWMMPGRAFRLANAGSIGVNPDQRMHEDTRHLTELSADLGIGLLQASILLISFISILWTMSSDFVLRMAGRSMHIPGYMVWAAIVYAGSASLLSYWVGRSLIDRNADRYAREADLRFSLVRVNEHIDAIALAAGEADEARRLDIDLANVLAAMRRLVSGITSLTWVQAGYGWFTLVAPILAAAPLYFAGTLSFGGLMMASGAFMQVQSSLRWFVDNFNTIADWRATLLRVANFRRAVMATAAVHGTARRIEIVEGAPGRLIIDALKITTRSGVTRLEEPHVELSEGERVLITAKQGSGKTLLFRALAGLYPWGEGRITRPKGSTIVYMPHTSYLPPGTLRDCLAYPSEVSSFETEAYSRALERLGLDRLVPILDEQRRWERELSDGEQQCLSFARAFLHAPDWLVIDEALGTLDEDALARVIQVLTKDLARTGVIYIGRPRTYGGLFGRVLHVTRDPAPRPLDAPRSPSAGILPQSAPPLVAAAARKEY